MNRWQLTLLLSLLLAAFLMLMTAAPIVGQSGGGLRAEYFDSKGLTGLKFSRVDSVINFAWDAGSPDGRIAPNTFSVRWTGYLVPRYSETYTLITKSDDGVRLWINDNLVIDNWTDHLVTQNSGRATLTAGKRHKIKLEYYDNTGPAEISLRWRSASQAAEIIPRSQLVADAALATPPTPTFTLTFTRTVTRTSTPATPTPTPSRTLTRTPTLSGPTPTPSRTLTRTPTLSGPTPTPSRTLTRTPTLSGPTPTPSRTLTRTPTLGGVTATPTRTLTRTPTISGTPPTPTRTLTRTSTVSGTSPTPTFTMTRSPTAAVPTATPTRTMTRTATPTATSSWTPSRTATVGPSPTSTATDTSVAAPFFGLDFGAASFIGRADAVTLAQNSGAGRVRDSLYWSDIEPVQGSYNFAWPDIALNGLTNAGFSPVIFITNNPSWAANTPCGPIDTNNSTIMTAFSNFLSTLAARYPQIKTWALYNEPDNAAYVWNGYSSGGCFGDHNNNDLNANGVNDRHDYARMLAAAWKAVHQGNPQAELAMGGVAYDFFDPSAPTWYGSSNGHFNYNFLPELFAYIQAHPLPNGEKYMDLMLFNYYDFFSWIWQQQATGQGIAAKAQELREVMGQYGLSFPLLVSESGTDSGEIGTQGQSACLNMTMVRGKVAGLRSIIWWTFKDRPEANHYYGLVDTTLVPKRSYAAFQTVVRELTGYRYNATYSNTTGFVAIEAYEFKSGTTSRIALWSLDIDQWNNYAPCASTRFNKTGVFGPNVSRLRIVEVSGTESYVNDSGAGDGDARAGYIGITIGTNPRIVQPDYSATPIATSVPTNAPTLAATPTRTATLIVTPTNTPSRTPTLASSPTRTPTPSAAANGLKGEYFGSKLLTSLNLTRTDPNIYFNWLNGAPDPSMSIDTFSVRWTGYIVPRYSERYDFITRSDDGVRLWINNQLLIDNWTDHLETQDVGSITLTAGVRYPFKLEYYDNTGTSLITLRWRSTTQALEIIPQSQFFTP